MSQIILLLDYEPRTVLRVTEALTPLGCEIVAAKDVDAAVNACAKVEPRAVLITSVLPRLKVEDAITQLRARAGLRNIGLISPSLHNPDQSRRCLAARSPRAYRAPPRGWSGC